jgi:arsenite/tail-anchored protein-transporting ATPase
MKDFIKKAPRFLFFTGKGGVGKTSMSCVVASALADQGRRVLLISTDPASNLDEVLETPLGSHPTPVAGQPGLWAMNIDPIQAATEYRERIVGPYRGVLPNDAVQSMEEQLSGACSVEIAAFNEFSLVIGDSGAATDYDHILLDTAPTGHTLRLLSLPAAWNDFVLENKSGSSCLGPLSGLKEQRLIYESAVQALMDPQKTLLVLVTRPEKLAFEEAARAGVELSAIGMRNQHLIVNGVFEATSKDPVAISFARQAGEAMEAMPDSLAGLPRTLVKFKPYGLTGLEAIRRAIDDRPISEESLVAEQLRCRIHSLVSPNGRWDTLLNNLAAPGRGLIMTMGKGGVGKTTMAVAIAAELARRGHPVHLSTTDPAAHLTHMLAEPLPNLQVSRIDPKEETRKYVAAVLEEKQGLLSNEDMALLEEEMRSPCIQEIAVFQAFARAVSQGTDRFMVLDTAPTGHTLLLLDATESYHREVAKNSEGLDEAVKQLLPRLRDTDFSRILLITLPEATPVHEAERLQEDLHRALIEPFAWVINQSFALTGTGDALLAARGIHELKYIGEVLKKNDDRVVMAPWLANEVLDAEHRRSLFHNRYEQTRE